MNVPHASREKWILASCFAHTAVQSCSGFGRTPVCNFQIPASGSPLAVFGGSVVGLLVPWLPWPKCVLVWAY